MPFGERPPNDPRMVGKNGTRGVAAPRTDRDYKSELDRRAWEASEAQRQQREERGGGSAASSMITTVSKLVEQVAQMVPEGKKLLGLEESSSSDGSINGNNNSSGCNTTDTTVPLEHEISDVAVEAFLRDVHSSAAHNRQRQVSKASGIE